MELTVYQRDLPFVKKGQPVEIRAAHGRVKASGKIAFEKGSRGYREQSKRLLDDGVVVNAGKVDMGRYRWQPGLDELLWKPAAIWDDN